MTPPDSGEREVVKCPFGCHRYRADPAISIPLPLAQRILAALVKRREWKLAAELRAIVERKP